MEQLKQFPLSFHYPGIFLVQLSWLPHVPKNNKKKNRKKKWGQGTYYEKKILPSFHGSDNNQLNSEIALSTIKHRVPVKEVVQLIKERTFQLNFPFKLLF